MANATNLAGVIGTWVAVSLALVALVGIVTPILLMRRARDERRIALSRIDDESKEIVHPGIKIPFVPAIGRTISVPKLDIPPKLDGQVRGRDDRPLDKKHSTTGWVMFTRTLKAYNIPQPPNGILHTDGGISWLRVHRLWILTIGLLGRYGHRPDRGRLVNAPDVGRIDQRDLEISDDPNALYGITGVMRHRPWVDLSTVLFSSHDKETRGPLEPDSVSFAVLFWLCMGCVPLLDGRVFDVSRKRVRERYVSIRRDDPLAVPTYRFQVIETSTPRSRILSWAQMLLGKLPELWWIGEYKVTTPEEIVEVEGVLENADDAEGISSPWIKVKSLPLDGYFHPHSLLWRSDVQCLALGILKMEWSPRGCLFDKRRGDLSRRLLCSAAPSLRALLEASCKICETSTSPTPVRTDLTALIKNLLQMCPPGDISVFSRALLGALYDFEQVLDRDYAPELDSMAIGVMFITSNIFRKFVLKTVRAEDSRGDILSLDPKSKSFTIIAPGTFSAMTFVLDFGAVFSTTLLPAPISLTLEKVLFAALRACVRSLVFKLSLDSADLMNFVGQIFDVVYISATPNVPLYQPTRAESSHEDRGRSPQEMIRNMEYMDVTISSDRSPDLRIETESSAHPTRASSSREDRLPRTIYADGVPYTREMSADRRPTAINADPVPSPETTRIKDSTKYSVHSQSGDQQWDSLQSGIRSAPADTALQGRVNI